MNSLELIRRGAQEIISEEDLVKRLDQDRPLVIKAGFDPTAPDLHLGHTVLLRKLKHFQQLGHKVVFLIGDATALVGDPSGQSKMRKMMTWNEVQEHGQTYGSQVSRILSTESAVFEQRYNSEWFGRPGEEHVFGLKELVDLTSRYTVARLIERDDFSKRLKTGQEVSMLELFYPLMQGYDSVQLKADVELGGTDQKFNLLVGRDLQRSYGQEPQIVLTMPLLEGTDGVQKMSKSLDNHIGVTDSPNELFGKVMSIPDTLILKYFILLTDVPESHLAKTKEDLELRVRNPRDLKAELAEELVRMYHGTAQAQLACEAFFRIFSKKELPDQMPSIHPIANKEGRVNIVELLVSEGLAKTKNDARRLLKQGGVKLNGQTVSKPLILGSEAVGVLQVGPRQFRKLH